MTEQIQIPKSGMDRLATISEKYKIPMPQLLEETQKAFGEPFVQNHPVLTTTEAKLDYATKIVGSNYNSRTQLETFDVIVWGIGRINTFKTPKTIDITALVEVDDKTREIIAKDLHPELNKPKPKSHLDKIRIAFSGKDVDRVPQIQTGCMYTTNLARSKAKNILYADDRTVFESPVKIDGIPELLAQVGITQCTIAETPKNLSKEEVTSTGTYADKLDMRSIVAMVGDYKKGGNPGEEWAFYIVTDETLPNDYVSPNGEVTVKQAFMVSVNPMWLVYERNSTLRFTGTLGLNKGSQTKPKPKPYEISMGAVLVEPIISMGEIKV
jgi:hypothetical protein